MMSQFAEVSPRYDERYFRMYRGGAYERSHLWLSTFGVIAEGIIREINPRTALDAGCALGLLVEALRDRGVEAYGIDISQHAIDRAREDIRPYCRVASIIDSLERQYDLIVCHEVIEHLPADQADRAIQNLCAATNDILFSSTPDTFDEDTHLNVQPPEYWASVFAKHGFTRDFDFDGSAFLSPWACRFRRRTEPSHRVLLDYERRLWALTRENTGLKKRALENAAALAEFERSRSEREREVSLAQTVAEQQDHIDALAQRSQYLSDREHELRTMLLNAHEQLLIRDETLRGRDPVAAVQELETFVKERTAWAQNAVKECEARGQLIQELQALVEERTAWAMGAVKDVEECRQVIRNLEALVEQRTAWAQGAVKDVEECRRVIRERESLIEERTAWAQSAAKDGEECRRVIRELEALVQERTVWGQNAIHEAEVSAANIEKLEARLVQQALDAQRIANDAQRIAKESEERDTALQAIANSRIWRATKPIRDVRSWMRRQAKA